MRIRSHAFDLGMLELLKPNLGVQNQMPTVGTHSGGRQSRFCETPARPHSPHMQFDSNCSGTGREQIEYSLKIMSPLRRVRATSTSANQGGERER